MGQDDREKEKEKSTFEENIGKYNGQHSEKGKRYVEWSKYESVKREKMGIVCS